MLCGVSFDGIMKLFLLSWLVLCKEDSGYWAGRCCGWRLVLFEASGVPLPLFDRPKSSKKSLGRLPKSYQRRQKRLIITNSHAGWAGAALFYLGLRAQTCDDSINRRRLLRRSCLRILINAPDPSFFSIEKITAAFFRFGVGLGG